MSRNDICTYKSINPARFSTLPIIFALIILTFAIANAYALPPSPLSISSINPTTPTIDNGQSITITGTWAGGLAPYNAVWYTGPYGTTCPQETANVLATYNGLSTTSNSITVSPTTTNSYCLGITDSESPPATQLSLNYTENAIASGFSSPVGVAFSPDGTYAYVTNDGGNNVVIINTASNTVVNSITSDFSGPEGVSISPSGTYAYVANYNSNNVVIINTASNTVTGSITSGLGYPAGVAFSPSGTYAYVANYNSNNVVIINTASNTVTGSINSGFSYPAGVAFSPSGTYAYVANFHSSNVVIINTATNTVTGSIPYGFSNPRRVAFSPSGTYAYVTNYGSNNIVIINTATNTVTGSITVGLNSPQGIAFSYSGNYAYVTNTGSNNVIVINTEAATTNSVNSEVMVNTGPQITNPYSGGSTGYFGPNSTSSSSTTSTITSSSTSTILPVTTIAPIIASPGTTILCNDSSGYTLNYPSLNATIKIAPRSGCFSINVINSTLQSKTLNRSVITALNYTVNNTNVSAEAILHYSCSIPASDITPFILRNGTWQEITPFTLDVATCTVEFAVPSDPVIALLNTNVTSTILTTVATTAVQTSVTTAAATPLQNMETVWTIIAIVIIIIVVVVLYLYSRRRK